MRETRRNTTWVGLARTAALAVVVLLLAGCATGYSFVQPDLAGAGGYYTGDGPYSGQGYYDNYGTGPYYPGTSGYGYYNGTRPYSDVYGYYGGYDGYGYGSQWIFNLGISNVWGFPGYWGPWYTTRFPGWGCHSWDCGNHYYRHHHRQHGHGTRPWREAGNPSTPSHGADAGPTPRDDIANRHLMDLSELRRDRYLPNPRRQAADNNLRIPVRPARMESPRPARSAFTSRPTPATPARMTAPAPQPFRPAPRATPRPAAARPASPARPVRPVVPSRSRHDGKPSIKIR